MQPSIWQFVKSQRATVPPVISVDLTGKTVVVTGGNGGIGYEAVKHFAGMNPAKVIIACRSKQRGEAAVARLKDETGFSRAEVRILDLAKFSSVTAFSDKLQKEEERLDILVANASIATREYRATEDGWEETLQVNNMATLLSCILLLPIMLKTAEKTGTETRIVIVGSGIHYQGKLEKKIFESGNPLKTFGSKEYCTPSIMRNRYTDSKIIDLFMTRSLAKVLANTPIIANIVDPGFCYSDLRREAKGLLTVAFNLMEFFMARTSDEGSRQLVWAALAENKGGEMRGAYVDSMAISEPSDYSLSKDGLVAQEKLWDAMVEELIRVDRRVSDILKGLT